MTVQRIEPYEVTSRAVAILGLNSESVDLFSIEGLSASLRRAASFLCPTSPRQIIDAVFEALVPLSETLDRDVVVETLDALVAAGDLLELRPAGERTRMLFLGPPSFVEKHPGEYLLLGIRPRAVPLLEEPAANLKVAYDAHFRSVSLDVKSASATLAEAGLRRLSKEQWTKTPRCESAAVVIEEVRTRLDAEHVAPAPISDLNIIDSAGSVLFYKGRWRTPNSDDNGIYIGRRPQAYGAPIWCAVEMAAGVPQVVLDLPMGASTSPGWDEARRIQAALDAENGTPHLYRVGSSDQPADSATFDFFMPLPSWAERYVAISGRPAERGRKALFSYAVPSAAVGGLMQFLSESLWMKPLQEGQEA